MSKQLFHFKTVIFTALTCLTITGCLKTTQTPHPFFTRHKIKPPTISSFTHCRGYGCSYKDQLSFTKTEWRDISRQMAPSAANAKEERKLIAQSIQKIENIIGEKNGTREDNGGTFRNRDQIQRQHDCVDEATNTTIYLTILKQQGLLKWHNVGQPDTRVPWMGGGAWPHQSAIIFEKESVDKYAVDSWFHDNGQPPEVISYKLWKKGWQPLPETK